MGLHVQEHKWWRGVGSLKPETKYDGSVLGCIRVLEDIGGFCGLIDPPAMII